MKSKTNKNKGVVYSTELGKVCLNAEILSASAFVVKEFR